MLPKLVGTGEEKGLACSLKGVWIGGKEGGVGRGLVHIARTISGSCSLKSWGALGWGALGWGGGGEGGRQSKKIG